MILIVGMNPGLNNINNLLNTVAPNVSLSRTNLPLDSQLSSSFAQTMLLSPNQRPGGNVAGGAVNSSNNNSPGPHNNSSNSNNSNNGVNNVNNINNTNTNNNNANMSFARQTNTNNNNNANNNPCNYCKDKLSFVVDK